MSRTALYRLYDSNNALLYVGVSHFPEARWKQHAAMKAWWISVARRTVEWHDTRDAAECEERRAIREESPLHNIQHNDSDKPLSYSNWWPYVNEVTGNASQSEIARRINVSQPSICRWREAEPKVSTARAFAKSYGRPVLEAFIAAGFISEADASDNVVPEPLSEVTTDAIIAELARRMPCHD